MPREWFGSARVVVVLAIALASSSALTAEAGMKAEPPSISGGGEAAGLTPPPLLGRVRPLPIRPERAIRDLQATGGVTGVAFEALGYDDNFAEAGFNTIPPDPIGAAGPDRVIAVVNTMIEARDKTGTFIFRDALKDFFAPLAGCPAPLSFPFDPKILYDHYAGRFLVVALERVNAGVNPSAGNVSRIYVAVSKSSSPATATAADWWFRCIDSKVVIGGVDYWADYPGFEVDEDAIYIVNNIFSFPGVASAYGGARLWIIHKGLVGGFYAGGPATVTISNPYLLANSVATTTMPALVHGAGGVGPGIGTFLLSYSGLTDGVDEFIQVIRVDDPLGAVGGPFFVGPDFVNLGNIETMAGALPDAPQLGSPHAIEVNDRRALDAVWRNGRLWFTTTINPDGPALPGLPDHTTAFWVELNTSAVTSSASPAGLITLSQQGGIPGEELGSGAIFTYFPSVAVNAAGHAAFGFSASGSSIYAGAYATSRRATDPAGTTRPATTLHAGRDWYVRTFDAPPCDPTPARNRWGDYSGISLDPTNDWKFWVFNEFADDRGTPSTGGCNGRPSSEDGRWTTGWASYGLAELSIGDVSAAEGDSGTTAYTFTVSLSNPTVVDVTVAFATSDSSARTGNSDYVGTSGTLTFPAKSADPETVTVLVNGDRVREGDELFVVNLSNPVGAAIADSQGVGTIQNDDAPPTLSINDVSAAEGNAGSTAFSFVVSLSNPSAQVVTVDYQTADSTATVANGDYGTASGTLTFPAKSAEPETVTVLVNGDLTNEGDEVFVVKLLNPAGAAIADSQGVGTIQNDDAAPAFSINDVLAAEGNAGTTAFRFVVSVSNPSAQVVTVDYQTADSTATVANGDYVAASGTLTFPAKSATPETVTVLVNGDLEPESAEVFVVNLLNAAGAAIADSQGVGTILDDEGILAAGEPLVGDPLVTEFALGRVTPNPTQRIMRIDYVVPAQARVRLSVLDLQGHEVSVLAEGTRAPGRYEGIWNGRIGRQQAPAGVYFVRLRVLGRSVVRRLVLAP